MSEHPEITAEAMPGEVFEQTAPPTEPRRRRKSIRTGGIIALAICALYYATSWSTPSFADWEESFTDAQIKAKATDRNMLVAFYMPGCPPCVIMDRRVLNTRTVKQALKSFVPVRLDASSDPAAGHFGVFATPTFLVATPAGEVLAKREGYQSVDEFVAFLGAASAKKPSQ